jgi:hypothetical protein
MGIDEKIREVDENYPVERILVNKLPFWPFYRVFFFDAQFIKGGSRVVLSFWEKIRMGLNVFYGFSNWWKKSDYFIFSNSDQRKEFDGKMIDKSADYIHDQLDNTLHIELPVFKHFPHSKLKYKRVVSHLPLRIVEFIVNKLTPKNQFEGLEILEELNKKYGVNLSGVGMGRRFYSQYLVMKWLLLWKKPKAVFMMAPYMKMGYVLASREMGIPVIEMQHGIINSSHHGYTNYKNFDSNLFPEYLLAYGEDVKRVFTGGNTTFLPEKVIPIGHYYLSLISKKSQKTRKEVVELRDSPITISVSLQDDFLGMQIVPFLVNVAQLRPNWTIVFVPRRTPQSEYESQSLPSNIIFLPELNVYEIISLCDIHTTICSTCALEAPSLGKPNVLVNIENKAVEYYSDILSDTRVNRFVQTPEEFVNEIEKGDFPDKSTIETSNNHVIKSDFDRNLSAFFQELGLR